MYKSYTKSEKNIILTFIKRLQGTRLYFKRSHSFTRCENFHNNEYLCNKITNYGNLKFNYSRKGAAKKINLSRTIFYKLSFFYSSSIIYLYIIMAIFFLFQFNYISIYYYGYIYILWLYIFYSSSIIYLYLIMAISIYYYGYIFLFQFNYISIHYYGYMLYSHKDINHNSNTIHIQMQADSFVSDTNGFINFWLRSMATQ